MIADGLKPKTPGQWAKLALIPVLSAGLLVALWQQPKSQTAESVTVSTPDVVASGVTDAAAAALAGPAKPVWPKARLEEVIAFNPFQAEQTLQTDESESAAAQAAGGNERSVFAKTGDKSRPRLVTSGKLQAIFVDGQGAAAILDSQVIRVGDTLPGGGRVVEITSDGIKLEGL